MQARYAFTNFNGGLASPLLLGRYDLDKYKNMASVIKNFVPQIHGSAQRRSGTRYIATAYDSACLIIPFSFNTYADNNFILAFSDYKCSVYNLVSGKLAEFTTPYASSDLVVNNVIKINYSQVGDIIYLAHEDFALHKIMRTGSTGDYSWDIEEVIFNVSVDPPSISSVTFYETEPSSGQTYPDRSYELSYKITAVDENGIESIASEAGTVMGRYYTDWVSGDYVVIKFGAVEGATEYNIYRESVGYYGYIGTVSDEVLSFSDQNYEADITDTPLEDWFPFEDGNNPSKVSFHNQRMILAGTKNSPQSFYMSRVGDFETFRKSRPLVEDDPVEYTLFSGSIDAIQWIASFGDLLIGTSGAEFKVTGSHGTGSAITATDVNITTQSFFGSSSLPPIIVGSNILHAQRYNAIVRDLYYSLEKDGYTGNNLNLLTSNFFSEYKLKDWTFQQTPNNTLYCVRSDGVIYTLTYVKEQDIYGWAEQATDGKFLSICTIADDDKDVICALVEREINGVTSRFIEYFSQPFGEYEEIKDACFLDCSVKYAFETATNEVTIPSHLVGGDFEALVDGSPYQNFEIEDGKVIFDHDVSTVLFGLPYESIIRMLPVNLTLDNGSTMGLKRSIGKCLLKVNRSVGGKFGNSQDNMQDFKIAPEYYDTANQPYSGEHLFISGGKAEREEKLYIGQDKPLPLELVSLVMELNFMENI